MKMRTGHWLAGACLLVLICLTTVSFHRSLLPPAAASGTAAPAVEAPVLKWQQGGCYDSWCETGWYASPAAADLNGDGQVEVIASAYSTVVLDGQTGSLLWRLKSGHDRSEPQADNIGRTWPDTAVADLDGNGDLEIITAHSGGLVSVYDHQGYFEPGWPQLLAEGSELRTLAVYDLEGDGNLEILAAATRSDNQWFALEHDGSRRSGLWPQHAPDSNTNGYTAGCYNQNAAAGDLDGDGRAEILGPNDTHYLAAYQDDGSQIPANPIYGTNPDGTPKLWSRVGVHVDHAVDLRGYADCGVEHRPNFAHSAPVIADVDGDGVSEAVVVGNVYNCGTDPYTDLYEIPYILNADRTRWSDGLYDWTVLPDPQPGAAPLSEDYNQIENSHPNPVPADLDGDGRMEILYPSYDGRLHAYWLDKTEHGSWPYEVTQAGEGFIRFAGEPLVADLNADGKAEVIFATWTEKGSQATGQLVVLDDQGNLLQAVDLPEAVGSDWNGALAAPTLANLDDDPDLEIVVNTAHAGVAAYDLPGTAQARVLWGTGRGSFQRSGSYLTSNLGASSMKVSKHWALPGEELKYTILLRNNGPTIQYAALVSTPPSDLKYGGGLTASAGIATVDRNFDSWTVTWTGSVPIGEPVTITFTARIIEQAPGTRPLITRATLTAGPTAAWELQAVTYLNGSGAYLPFFRR